jgi:hypothetical protein
MTTLEKFRLLCRCLAPDNEHGKTPATDELATQLGDESNWPELIRMAGDGLVTPALAGTLKRLELFVRLPNDAQTYLSGIRALNIERNAILREELHRITGWLNEIGIQPVLLKGAINLVTEQYPGSGDRVIGDLDLLIPASRLDEACRTIQRDEYAVPEQYDDDFLRRHHHAPHVLHSSRPVSVELHRDLCRESLRGLLPTDRCLAHSTAMEWQGLHLRLPAPTDRVMHTFVHTQLQDRCYTHRYLALRSLLEFAWQAQALRDAIDWQEIVNRLDQETGTQPRAAWLAWLQAGQDLFAQQPPGPFTPGRIERWRHKQVLHAMTSRPVSRFFYWNRRVCNGIKRRFKP